MKVERRKLPDLLDRNIFVWMPMSEGQPFIAMIDGAPILFKAASAIAAKRAADEWRKEERSKYEAQMERAAKRAEQANAERAAKRADAGKAVEGVPA